MEISRCSVCGEYLGDYAVHSEYYKYFSKDENMKSLDGFICNKCVVKHSEIEKLYHVSFQCDIVDEFYPRIPENRHSIENSEIGRICLSSSIERCLSAVPNGGVNLENIFWEDGSSLIRVYEFDIKDLNLNNLVSPEYLYQKNLVVDAEINQEYWIVNQNLAPSKTYLIKLIDYEEGCSDEISYEDYVLGIRSEEEGNSDFDWEDVIMGCFTEIQDLSFEIVPEERRSGRFTLNHKITGITEEDERSVESDIYEMFPSIGTYIYFEKDEHGNMFIKGTVDSRGLSEYDRDDIINFINSGLRKGVIQTV